MSTILVISIMLIICGVILGGFILYINGQIEKKYSLYKDLKATYYVKKVN